MFTFEKKFAIIIKLAFSKILKKLKTYVKLTDWMRNYISYYAQMTESLKKRKILLLKNEFSKSNSKKRFSVVRMLKQPIIEKYESYQHLQKTFSKSNFLIHFSLYKSSFINVNAFKQMNIDVMIFHVISDSKNDETFDKNQIQSIMFLNKRLSSVETRYWFTKLEMTDVIWIVKKMRHLIKSCRKSLMSIFTNHAIIAEIVSQIFLTTINTNKLNLRLIRVSQFLFILLIRIRVKSEKLHVVSNALSRLKFIAIIENTFILKNLDDVKFMTVKFMIVKSMMIMNVVMREKLSWNVNFHFVHEVLDCQLDENIFFIKMSEKFFSDLKQAYKNDDQWFRFKIKLKIQINFMNTSDEIEFILKNNHIYFVFEDTTPHLCISWSMKKIIFATTHDENHHCDFHRVYVRISESLYIRHLVKRLRKYIKHCKKCIENQIIRHVFYDELHSIKSIALSFHIIIIDFIFALSEISDDMNSVFITTNKFSKRISLMSDKITWFASKWAESWLIMLQKKNWNLFKAMIFDRNSKFVISFWKATFHHLKIALLYITIYHSQTNEQSKRTNQIVKIAVGGTLAGATLPLGQTGQKGSKLGS